MNEDALAIANKFQVAKREIERLRAKIHIQKGAWLFKQHIYSIQDLLESEHFDRIYAICEKIGDDVIHWVQSGRISDDGLLVYRNSRDNIQYNLRLVNKEIEERVPTLWENILSILEEFVVLISKVLPAVKNLMSLATALFGGDLPKQLGNVASKLLKGADDAEV